MNIEIRTPVRLDLAGGTVDLWPLYLLFPGAATIPMGIDLFVNTRIHWKAGPPRITLQSVDQKKAMDWQPPETPKKKAVPPGLILHSLFVDHFVARFGLPEGQLEISTEATSPAGAGLGGSSALSISLISALSLWFQRDKKTVHDLNADEVIALARDIESRVLWGPAGLQDYYGAFFGGLQKIEWRPASHLRTPYPDATAQELSKRLLLFYSGQSRNSGINNWKLYQGVICKDASLQKKFQRIVNATQTLDHALSSKDWKGVGKAIREEWKTRETLAKGISTPAISKAMKLVDKQGAGKICGAGGGGCFFLYTADVDPERQRYLIKKITGWGMRSLPFQPVPQGTSIQSMAEVP